ncbi:MAG: oxygen-dependent coproporphyrinogen oxidase [Planctomycetota bacterium]
MRDTYSTQAKDIQDQITRRIEEIDGGRFREDSWEREGGGGGRSRVLEDGEIFEKAGVNFSEVHGSLSEDFSGQLPGEGSDFFAAGISLVMHPRSPMVPTVHANFRYIEKGDKAWFGGGADLTPYYLVEDDAVHFHRTWKTVCDRHDPEFHPRFKAWCDEYFHLTHRQEARGVGGIFFDYLDVDEKHSAFWADAGGAFLDAYVPIVERRKNDSYGEEERLHQLRRRGRYVEFNLIYDRGTVFGLKTGGRTESILMSLPPLVRWDYDAAPEPGTREAELIDVLKNPRDWLEDE